MRKNDISEKINSINKQKENNLLFSNIITYINDKNIENNTQRPNTLTTANNRNTAAIIQRENKFQTGNQPIENEAGNIFIIMDSNRMFICFKKLLAEELTHSNASIITISCGILTGQGTY